MISLQPPQSTRCTAEIVKGQIVDVLSETGGWMVMVVGHSLVVVVSAGSNGSGVRALLANPEVPSIIELVMVTSVMQPMER